MKTVFKRSAIEKEFSYVCENPSVRISLTDFFMEAGFQDSGNIQEKYEFYAGAIKLVNFIKLISDVINEETVFAGSFIKHQKNYYEWKNIKKFDAYNNLRENLGQNEIKNISIVNSNFVDLIVECNLRYFSRIMLYFPDNRIFIRPDVHCYLEVYGSTEQLKNLCSLLQQKANSEYIIEYDV